MSDIKIFSTNNLQESNNGRVNLNDPSTIMNYGNYVLKKIDELKDNYSTMDDDYEIDSDMQEKIKNIDFFKRVEENEKTKKEEERKKKSLNSNFLMKGINNLFRIEERMESNVKTYGDLYREFVDNVDAISFDIEKRKESNVISVDRTKEFLNIFRQYVSELEELINLGYEDKTKFEESLNKMEIEDNVDPSFLNTLRGNVQFFESVLVELKECLVNYQNEITEFEIMNRGTMEVVFRQDAFIRRYMSSVRGQGALIIGSKRQKDDVDQLTGIKAIINNTIKNNAKQITDNIERINKLTCENFIEDSTFKTVNTMLQKGVELIINSDKQHKERLQKRNQTLDLMAGNMQKYSDSLLRLSSSTSSDTHAYDESIDQGYQKKKTIK